MDLGLLLYELRYSLCIISESHHLRCSKLVTVEPCYIELG